MFDLKSTDNFEKLGEGGFGAVYKVKKRITGDFYALKVQIP